MEREAALALVLNLAQNGLPFSATDFGGWQNFKYVIDDMHSSLILKYYDWFERYGFIEEIY